MSGRLGYLLKHAMRRLATLSEEVLAPFGIDDRRLAVLLLIRSNEPMSQQQAAERLEIDRTTMVAVLDDLDAKHLVTRVPHPEDRRRNVVELTASGRVTLDRAVVAWDTAERIFLANLDAQSAEQFRALLRQILDTTAHVRS